jgi:hypothetical protein
VRLNDKVLFIEATPPWQTEITSTSTRSFYEKILTLAAMRVGLPVESTWIIHPPKMVHDSTMTWRHRLRITRHGSWTCATSNHLPLCPVCGASG